MDIIIIKINNTISANKFIKISLKVHNRAQGEEI